MDSHKGTYDSPSKASVVEEILQVLIDDITTSHTSNQDEETATEQHNLGNRPLGAAAATTATHSHTNTEHETALSREVEDILRGLIDEAIASAYEDEEGEPVPGGGGGGQRSALAALLARMTSEKRGGNPPAVIVISSDEEGGSSDDDEPFPRSLMRRSKRGKESSASLAGTPGTAATDTTGRSSDLPSPSSARSCGASTSGSGSSADVDAGRRETIVAKIQQRPAVEFPRHAYGRRQKRRYETSSEDDEGADRGRGRRRRSGRVGEQAPTLIDLTLDSESEGHGRADASASPAAAPGQQPPKEKNRQEQKQKHEGNDRQKRRPEPAGKRNSIGQMAAAAARSGKRWRYSEGAEIMARGFVADTGGFGGRPRV
ncbi:hypothetical protein DL766_000239 [Monosporascus sp. MC13-8B]|uniref:Uncharacterized protein n=1 Tax=Monosporascus cannonballus TaxID=155416 RepID=A0ABY0H4N9_9PEZI|nr:hypothetical protein DL762_005509 [Monosporascus cannonballus]RYO93093.1 hypothetical protein DL763_004489 [Monosporascus cannonballus]RYP39797.1 hypothetical protein DL766_000239 [Monosporascus sp. MC13-8B]